eukprot:TRINITY_DN16882_c0_g1_i1.p2 TRINITY_DN16882_c0_g1~~TRINITY_DN16882_c0_g1_i1.p2  ORF type:complete len:113 (-),score=9.20 TRINITY_DN16882_c0_g1_i1:393-731(-)
MGFSMLGSQHSIIVSLQCGLVVKWNMFNSLEESKHVIFGKICASMEPPSPVDSLHFSKNQELPCVRREFFQRHIHPIKHILFITDSLILVTVDTRLFCEFFGATGIQNAAIA